jgi:myosin heavy subunit
MVGILIILVVVAGLRAKQTPDMTREADVKVAEASRKYEQSQQAFGKIRDECEELSARFQLMRRQNQIRKAEYDRFMHYKTQLDNATRSYAETLGGDSQAAWELRREFSEIQAELDELNQRKEGIANQKPDAVVLENRPTPISRNADEEKEIQFRLKNGRIAFVPFPQLIDRLKISVMQRRNELLNKPRIEGTLGPVEGFQMEYRVARQDLPMEMANEVGTRSMIMLEECRMIPVGDDAALGESLADALKSSSQFRTRLAGCRQNEYTVTVWVYPDSFNEYQTIKDFLYHNGYRAAARPLEFGYPISASPMGTKSANQ